MFQGKIRATVELTYVVDGKEEARDLLVTFGLIDRISSKVDWAAIPEKLNSGSRPLADITKFVAYCMIEAGFDLKDDDIDNIYDELTSNDSAQESFTVVAMRIINAFMPKGKKKATPTKSVRAKKVKK